MVAVDRPGVDDHLMRARNLTQQLSRPLPYVPTQHREPIFRDPHHVILAVPDRVATRLRVLHNRSVASRSPKGEGFTDPRCGTLNRHEVARAGGTRAKPARLLTRRLPRLQHRLSRRPNFIR